MQKLFSFIINKRFYKLSSAFKFSHFFISRINLSTTLDGVRGFMKKSQFHSGYGLCDEKRCEATLNWVRGENVVLNFVCGYILAVFCRSCIVKCFRNSNTKKQLRLAPRVQRLSMPRSPLSKIKGQGGCEC